MDTTSSNSSSQLEDFQYDPFPSPEWIRLLRLNHTDTSSPVTNAQVSITLSTFPTSSAPAYAALSYTWGSSYFNDQMTADRTHPIICNGARVLASQNLSLALQSRILRHKLGDNGYLWADAICLNQADLSERAEQVARMSEIYKNASSVIIWLGPADDNAAVAFPLVTDMAPRLEKAPGVSAARYNPGLACCYSYERAGPLNWHYTHPLLWLVLARKRFTKSEEMALMGLLERHWFERAWVIQEVVLAKGPVAVICGDDLSLEWDDLVLVCRWVVDSDLGHAYQEPVRRDSNLPLLGLGTGPTLMEKLKWANNTLPSPLSSKLPSEMTRGPDVSEWIDKYFFSVLLRLIYTVRMYLATDGRDKIFVPVAMAMDQFAPILQPDSPAKQLLPNYRITDADIFITASRLIITHTRDLALLMEVEVPIVRATRTDLPSWVPDFSQGKVWPLCHEHPPEKERLGCMWGSKHTTCSAIVDKNALKCKGARVDFVDVGFEELISEEEKVSGTRLPSIILGLRLLNIIPDRTRMVGLR